MSDDRIEFLAFLKSPHGHSAKWFSEDTDGMVKLVLYVPGTESHKAYALRTMLEKNLRVTIEPDA